tara:strand:+ start:572 stop:1081 length:510 start_codon:yes stop_codon:yes gene_type:complete
MKFLIIFVLFISSSHAGEIYDHKNIVVYQELKKHEKITFLDHKKKELNLDDYRGKLILLNFWASWCAPCKEEMPSLDSLQVNKQLLNLKIFPINIGQDSLEKASNFLNGLGVKNLDLYFDSKTNLAKKFELRGIPTSILLNKDGHEFARIVGSIDFNDENFIRWLKSYN